MIKLVIFDLDDTLISEKEYVKSGLKVVAEHLKNKYVFENSYEELLELFEEDSKFLYNRYLERKGLNYSEKEIMELVKIYREHDPQISYYDDVLPTLRSLKERKIQTAIISDGNLITQRKKAEAVNLYQNIDNIIFTDELGKEFWKPNSKAFEVLKEKLKIEYNEMIYVGDNPRKDFYVSNSIPIHTIRIYRPEGIYLEVEYLKNIKEEYKICGLNEILNIIDQIK